MTANNLGFQMARKREIKEERLGIRISSKLRFGIDLIARKYRVSESEAVARCVELALDAEGLTQIKDGELFSGIDSVWSKSPAFRALKLAGVMPELATADEKRVLNVYKGLLARYASLGEVDLFGPYRVTEDLVDLIDAYLGISSNPNLAAGDEEAFLYQCDTEVMFSNSDIAKECQTIEAFRKKYVTS